jgi:hypothetical protein
MTCYLSYAIGISLIVATLAVSLFGKSFGYMATYENGLNAEQKAYHESVVKERAVLFIQGTILGLLLGAAYYLAGGKNVCAFLLLFTATQYFFYTLAPKTKWMLDVLQDKEDIKAWSDVYRYFKWLYHIAFLVSIVGAMLVFRGMCSK